MKKLNKILTILFFFVSLGIKAENTPPNIIWIMLEDVSLDTESYGMKGVSTPTMNSLAKEGTQYYNCFGTASICSTNRSAMMLGTHQLKTNTQHHRSNREMVLPDQYKPYTYWLKQSGYTTILGHDKVMHKGRKTDCNFKYKAVGDWDKDTGLFDKYGIAETQDQPFVQQITLHVTHRGDWWNKVRNQSEEAVALEDVQLPEFIAEHPKTRLDWAKYLDQMEYADAEVKMIVEELKEKGMYENTIIIIIGDNGRCNVRGKGYLYDSALRIPLIVKWAENSNPHINENAIISSPDITATILDLAGVEIPSAMTGKSFITAEFDRKEVLSFRGLWDEIEEESYAISTSDFRYIKNHNASQPYDAHQAYLEFYRPAIHVMRTLKEEGKLTPYQQWFFESKPEEELYDLKNDPLEKVNLAENVAFKSVLKNMRKRLKEQQKITKADTKMYDPVFANAVNILQYVKDNYPSEYQKMLEGDEIGFYKYVQAYKKMQK